MKFALHSGVGILLFCIAGLAAVVLHLFTHWLENTGISDYIISAMRGLFVFAVDFILLAIFIAREALALGKELIGFKEGGVR